MASTSTSTRKSKPAAQTHTGVNVLISTPLHRKARVKAMESGLTLAEAVEAALKQWVGR